MMRAPGVVVALLLAGQLAFPAAAGASEAGPDRTQTGHSRFELPKAVFTAAAAQPAPVPKQKSAGGRFLRHALIGAAIGGAAAGLIASAVGDCGDCTGDTINAVLQGAFYGSLVGMAVTIHPSRRPFPNRAGRAAGVNLTFRF